MAEFEIHIEASTEADLAFLRAEVTAEIARLAPGATFRIGTVERTEGAADNKLNNVIWATIVAPIMTGTILFGIQEVYKTAQPERCVVAEIDQGIRVETEKGEIVIVIVQPDGTHPADDQTER